MLKLWVFLAGVALQTLVRAQAPRILYISREFWKPGHEAALNRIEAVWRFERGLVNQWIPLGPRNWRRFTAAY